MATENTSSHRHLLTAEAANYRRATQDRLLEYLELPTWSRALGATAERIRDVPDILTPHGETTHPVAFDALCAALETPRGAVALLHSRSGRAGPEGVGRSTTLLRYLGLEVVYDLPDLSPQAILQGVPPRFEVRKSTGTTLVSSDMAFLRVRSGRLIAAPVIGEQLLGLWDLARHLYRLVDPDYDRGMRLKPFGRQILEALVRVLPAQDLIACYAADLGPRTIDTAVIFDLSDAQASCATLDAVGGEERRRLFQSALNSVLHLDSLFWARNREEHERLATELVSKIRTWPVVLRISVPIRVASTTKACRYLASIYKELDRELGMWVT